jgi:hypothetical protein
MHLLFAQHSVQSGGTKDASEIKEQLRKSIALSLKAAHKEKDTALVISGSCLSAQGEEVVSSETFADLLREVLIADMMQSGDGQFNCVFITMASPQQEEVFHRCFEEWEKKNLISAATQMDSIGAAASNDMTHISVDEKVGGISQAPITKNLFCSDNHRLTKSHLQHGWTLQALMMTIFGMIGRRRRTKDVNYPGPNVQRPS